MVTTNKEINLGQLSRELAGIGLVASHNENGEMTIGAADGYKLTDKQLQTAIDAHVAVDEIAEKATKRDAVLAALAAAAGLEVDEVKAALGA